MRNIYAILTVLILSSACNAQSSPNVPPSATLPASPNTPPAIQPTPPPTAIQPTTLHSDEAIRIARAEMERDAYKQAVEAYRQSIENFKWAGGLVLTAIGIILVLFGYAAYKETKKYEEATANAQKACEKAEQWEEKSKSAFEKIDTSVENKLKEIDERVKVELKQIEKQGKESIENIVKQTQKETLISTLYDDAFRLKRESEFEEACEKYAEIVKLQPNDHTAYYNWGITLADWAKLTGDDKLFEQAFQKYEQAIKIKPDKQEAYCNWGVALAGLARIKNNAELFREASRKYSKAVEIKPDYHKAYNNLGGTFIGWAKLKIGTPEYESLLNQAEEKCLKAESLKSGSGAYNLSCISALRGKKEECRKWLMAGQEAEMLPTREHAMKDKDLESVKNEQWFKDIKWKGEK